MRKGRTDSRNAANFVRKQTGVVKRMLLRGKYGGYADLVFFRSKDDADRVAKIEETSVECLELFKIMEAQTQVFRTWACSVSSM